MVFCGSQDRSLGNSWWDESQWKSWNECGGWFLPPIKMVILRIVYDIGFIHNWCIYWGCSTVAVLVCQMKSNFQESQWMHQIFEKIFPIDASNSNKIPTCDPFFKVWWTYRPFHRIFLKVFWTPQRKWYLARLRSPEILTIPPKNYLLVRFTQGIFEWSMDHHIRNVIIPATPSNPSSNPSSNPTFSTSKTTAIASNYFSLW